MNVFDFLKKFEECGLKIGWVLHAFPKISARNLIDFQKPFKGWGKAFEGCSMNSERLWKGILIDWFLNEFEKDFGKEFNWFPKTLKGFGKEAVWCPKEL